MPGFKVDVGEAGGGTGGTIDEDTDIGAIYDLSDKFTPTDTSGGRNVVGGGGGGPQAVSGGTPTENTGEIDVGETVQIGDQIVDEPLPTSSITRVRDDGLGDGPATDDGFSSGFWDTVLPDRVNRDVQPGEDPWADGTPPDNFEGPLPGPGTIRDDRVSTEPTDEQIDRARDRIENAEPDWNGDGAPGGNLSDNPAIPEVPDIPVPDPQEVVSGITATVIGALIVAYFIGTRGAGS